MAKILFNITNGTNNQTKASLGFMLARTAVEEGHEVIVFLNADAVSLIRPPVLDNLVGLGTGSLKEHFEVLKKSKSTNVRFSNILRNKRCNRARS